MTSTLTDRRGEAPITPITPITPIDRTKRLTWLLHHAIAANEAVLRDLFRELDISMAQFLVLADLAPGLEVPPARLAHAAGVSRQSMHACLRRMAKRGLVRLFLTYDGRGAKLVSITTSGRAVHDRAMEKIAWFEDLIALRLGQPGRDELAHLVQAYVRAIEQLWNRPSVVTWDGDD